MGSYLLVDPTQEEERYCDARLSIATLDAQTVCALQKGGAGALTIPEIDEMVQIALRLGIELRSLVSQA